MTNPVGTAPEAWGAAHVRRYDAFLSGLAARDRANVERHVAACEGEATPGHARLWKRLTCSLAALAPHPIQTMGQRAVRFFVADGRHRMQVFALEDPRDGTVHLYAGDALDEAIETGVLARPSNGDGDAAAARLYPVDGEPGGGLTIEPLTAAQTTAAPDFYRHMLGWNRRALKVTLPTTAAPAEVAAAEALCALAVRRAGG